jgi:hypothetical protein
MSRDPLHDFAARGARAQEAVDELLGKPTRATKAKACAVCGCTDDRACLPQGCSWVTRRPPVCSACVTFFMNIRDRGKFDRTLEHFGLTTGTTGEVADLLVPVRGFGLRPTGEVVGPDEPAPRRKRQVR